jgi:hypothetical protein
VEWSSYVFSYIFREGRRQSCQLHSFINIRGREAGLAFLHDQRRKEGRVVNSFPS